MPDFDLTGELSLNIELHMVRPITEKVHSGNGPVSLVCCGFILGDFDYKRLIFDGWVLSAIQTAWNNTVKPNFVMWFCHT